MQETADTPISLGIGCNDGTETVKNEFYRVYDLNALGITTTFTVSKVSFGLYSYDGQGDIDVSAAVGTYTGTISTSTLSGTFTPIGNPTPVNLSNGSNMMIDVPMTEAIPGGSQLYIEIIATAGVGDTFFLGANTAGESATGYVQNKSTQCGQGSPTNATTADGSTTNLIMNVTGTY